MDHKVHTERYELIFQLSGAADDVVRVRLTDRLGAGGFPVYEDETGIVRAEISDRGEVRMLASGGHQVPGTPLLARPLNEDAPRPFRAHTLGVCPPSGLPCAHSSVHAHFSPDCVYIPAPRT